MKKLGILLAAVAVLIGGVYWASLQTGGNPFLVSLQASEVKEKLEKGDDFSLYVYSDTCIHCKEFAPVLQDYLKEKDTKIYRVATTTASEDKAVKDLIGEKFQGTPSMFSFKNGELKDYFSGSKTKEYLNQYAEKNKAIFKV